MPTIEIYTIRSHWGRIQEKLTWVGGCETAGPGLGPTSTTSQGLRAAPPLRRVGYPGMLDCTATHDALHDRQLFKTLTKYLACGRSGSGRVAVTMSLIVHKGPLSPHRHVCTNAVKP